MQMKPVGGNRRKYRYSGLDTDSLYLYRFVMGSVQQAVKILREAEGRLRSLMNEDIEGRRYAELLTLAGIAYGLVAMLRDLDASPAEGAAEQRDRKVAHTPVRKASPKVAATSPTGMTREAKKASMYPYFEVDEGWIGKVGWSKKNREEYRHYAPISAALALAEHVDRTQQPGRVWTVEDIGEVVDSEAGEAMPSYQLYLVIAWMRSVGLLTKQGRSGYVAVGGGTLLPGVKNALHAA